MQIDPDLRIPTQEEMHEIRRQQILNAADRSFRKNGFHATTLRLIAKEFGMSVGLIYNYFESKEAIVEALIRRESEHFVQLLTREIIGTPGHEQTFYERMSPVVDLFLDPEIAHVALAIDNEALTNEKIRRVVEENNRYIRERIEQLVFSIHKNRQRTPRRERLFRKRLAIFLAFLQGSRYLALFNSGYSREEYKDLLIQNFYMISRIAEVPTELEQR